jgi:hypothetical protein
MRPGIPEFRQSTEKFHFSLPNINLIVRLDRVKTIDRPTIHRPLQVFSQADEDDEAEGDIPIAVVSSTVEPGGLSDVLVPSDRRWTATTPAINLYRVTTGPRLLHDSGILR